MLYNDLYKQLLQWVIPNYEFKGAVEIVIDRFLYGDAQERFDNYLADGLMRSINVSHLDSKTSGSEFNISNSLNRSNAIISFRR